MKRTLAAVAIAATLTALGAGAAHAEDSYPAPAPLTTVSEGTVQAGSSVTFAGSGFTPGEQIIITAESGASGASAAGSRSVAQRVALAPLQVETQADSAGKFSVEVALSEPGVYTLTAKGVTSGLVQTNTVTVQAPVAGVAAQSTLPDRHPDTGAEGLLLWTLLGAGALAAGISSVVVVKRGGKTATA